MSERASLNELDDEDEPPILGEENNAPSDGDQQASGTPDGTKESSIMDEMISTARRAKESKRQQQAAERNRTGFGSGLKRGFFKSRSSKGNAKMRSKTKSPSNQRLDVHEDKKPSSLLVTKPSNQEKEHSTEAIVFPEVQEALQESNSINSKGWVDESLIEKIKTQPHLLQALQNPRFAQAIQDLQRDPQAAIRKYQHDADVSRMLRDFMGFLGAHWEGLSKEESSKQQQHQASPAIVDLDAARRDAIDKMPRAPSEEAQVQRILQDPALMTALSDATLMEHLRRAQQDPAALHQLLAKDPHRREQLRLLTEAGLLKFA